MERPILFSTQMIQQILDGKKTQTRRIIKSPTGRFEVATANYEPNAAHYYHNREVIAVDDNDHDVKTILCPYGQSGDVLWVRETWRPIFKDIRDQGSYELIDTVVDYYEYKADKQHHVQKLIKWKPSIFMPKEACRIKLLIKDIRVERLQDISEEDAVAEIRKFPGHGNAVMPRLFLIVTPHSINT